MNAFITPDRINYAEIGLCAGRICLRVVVFFAKSEYFCEKIAEKEQPHP